MEEIKSWTLARIEQMIADKVIEDLYLDYKRSIDKVKDVEEITKDVSSFANSDGGVIIYGIGEDKDKHFPEVKMPMNFNIVTKEWLESCIDKVAPKISGLKITPVYTNEAEKFGYYVVVIPKGHTVHQAVDCKYYKRGNFKSEPMRHYEVLDVLARSSLPKVSLSGLVTLGGGYNGFHFYLALANVGNKLIKHWKITIEVAKNIRFNNKAVCVSGIIPSMRLESLESVSVLNGGSLRFNCILASYETGKVLYPGETQRVVLSFESQNVTNDSTFDSKTDWVNICIHADDMPYFYARPKISELFEKGESVEILPLPDERA